MSKLRWKVVLRVAFTALWFGLWVGVKHLLNGSFGLVEALFFFVIFGLVSKEGVGWIWDRHMKDHEDKFGKDA